MRGRWIRPTVCSLGGRAIMALAVLSTLGAASLHAQSRVEVDSGVVALESVYVSQSPAIGMPALLQIVGEHLWVTDPSGDPSLHLVDAETGRLIRSRGASGEGPGDFVIAPFDMTVRPGDSLGVWAFDPYLQRFTRFEGTENALRILTLVSTTPVTRVSWVSPNRIIGVRSSAEHRLILFDSLGSVTATRPAAMLVGPADAPLNMRLRAMNSGIRVCDWPGRGFAIAFFDAGRIEFYNTAGAFVRRAQVPHPKEPVFTPNDEGELQFRRGDQQYKDCSAGGGRLYALYSGREDVPPLVEEGRLILPDPSSREGRTVHVFDWDGRLLETLLLDADAGAITVDSAGENLYTTSLQDAGIRRYELPRDGGAR